MRSGWSESVLPWRPLRPFLAGRWAVPFEERRRLFYDLLQAELLDREVVYESVVKTFRE